MDTVVSLLEKLNLWAWWAIAGVILIAELLTGTTYLLWPAAAAFLTGFIALELFGVAWPAQLAVFAVLSIGLLWAGDRWVRPRLKAGSATGLNDRSSRMVGQRVVAVSDFSAGRGRVKYGDTEWAAETADTSDPAAGTALSVLSVSGVILQVSVAPKAE